MATRKRILVVDDDDEFRQTLDEQLRLHGELVPAEAATGADALEKTKAQVFDIIVLDVGLPDMDGRDVCRRMRRDGVTAPIIMLTGASSDADVMLAFDAGADDHVTKPFHLGVLLARLRAHIRKGERDAEAALTIGTFSLIPGERRLLDNETKRNVRLTEKETQILSYMFRAQGRTIDRRELLSEIWGYGGAVETHTLDTHVSRLRKKIERDPANPRILVTARGGYRLVF